MLVLVLSLGLLGALAVVGAGPAVVPIVVVVVGAVGGAVHGGMEGMRVIDCGGGDTTGEGAPFGDDAIDGGGDLLEGVAVDVSVVCHLLLDCAGLRKVDGCAKALLTVDEEIGEYLRFVAAKPLEEVGGRGFTEEFE